MQLSDFIHIQNSTRAFEHFFESPKSIEIKGRAFDNNEGGTVLSIGLSLPRSNQSMLNIGHNPNGFVHQAVIQAVTEWMTSKHEEVAVIALKAAKSAEIEAAKQLSKSAINILSIANQ